MHCLGSTIKGFNLNLPGGPLYSSAELAHGMCPTGHSQWSQVPIHFYGVSSSKPFWSLHSCERETVSSKCSCSNRASVIHEESRGAEFEDLSKTESEMETC